ncbi:hypothetical protein OH768_15360 [Streptomyces sp. NBC_01622]|nr:hypothetical protein OH768_15360 [Streptomyces sp. NBC_01622]
MGARTGSELSGLSEELELMEKAACAHCGQDRVRCYEHKDTGRRF